MNKPVHSGDIILWRDGPQYHQVQVHEVGKWTLTVSNPYNGQGTIVLDRMSRQRVDQGP